MTIAKHPTDEMASEEVVGSLHSVLRSVRKIDLHAHLSGCIRLSTVEELIETHGLDVPQKIRADLRRALVLTSRSKTYVHSFSPWRKIINKVTEIPGIYERLLLEVAQDMADDNVIYAELRVPARIPFKPSSFQSTIEDAHRASIEARRRYSIDVRAIVGFDRQLFSKLSRHQREEMTRGMVSIALPYRGNFIVGFDMWGVEAATRLRHVAHAFASVRAAGFPLAIHAGEAGSPNNIRDAIQHLHCRRIGHATQAIANQSLVDLIIRRQVSVEICLTSNYLTGASGDLVTHPLRQMRQAGVRVVLCTDNTLVYGTSLSMEYSRALAAQLVSAEDLLGMAIAAPDLAFLSPAERADLKQRVRLSSSERDTVLAALKMRLRANTDDLANAK